MEIMPGVHQIPVNFHGRPLKLYLLRGPDIAMLMDTGESSTPDTDILPYFASIGFDPRNLTHVMATHPDLDHTGGLHRIHEVSSPTTRFVCGTLDREQVESPEGLADIRARAHYYWHQVGMDDAARSKFIARAGGYVPISMTCAGGETLRFSATQYAHVLHLPGHSHGHLGVYLPWLNAAIIGDAVHGTANRFLDGKAAFACTYMYIDSYLGTIDRLQAMKLDRLYSCHWADCTGNAAVNGFLNTSRDYALNAERTILETVKSAGDKGMTLRDVCLAAKPRLGDWPAEKDLETRSMACGHLDRLAANGFLRVTETPPLRYTYEPVWRGLR
jgi:glyoxylase-like metal-dependent hydrolase (beta-lactamase superfamily II)